jgi:hypothetical protein
MSRSFELLQLASVRTFQQHVQTTLSVRPAMGFLSKTQMWENRCNRPNDVDSRPNALIHKASRAFKIQTSGRQSSWYECASIYMEIECIKSTVRTTIHLVRTHEASIWKLRAAEVWLSGRQGSWLITQLSVRTGPRFYQARHLVENSKNSILNSLVLKELYCKGIVLS